MGQARDTIDPDSPLVHVEEHGLPIHGLHLVDQGWEVTDQGANETAAWLAARLPFGERQELLAQFPYPW